MPDTPTVPSEYEIGLGRGKLGDWIAEVDAAGYTVTFMGGWGVAISKAGEATFHSGDRDIERAFVQAFIAWKERGE